MPFPLLERPAPAPEENAAPSRSVADSGRAPDSPYGFGRSEQALSQALAAAGRTNGEVVVATKWFAFLRTARSIRNTIDDRLRRLGRFSIDLHQVHMPYSFSSVEAEMEAMADLVAQQKIRAVGVSDFKAAAMRRAHAALARRGIPLASNHVSYSLVHRGIESNGVLAAAKELGATIIAYSPLAQGVLSGKFHDQPSLIRSRQGPRRYMSGFSARGLERSRPVVGRRSPSTGASASTGRACWRSRARRAPATSRRPRGR